MYCYAGALYVVDKWKEDNVNTAKQQAIQISYTGNISTATMGVGVVKSGEQGALKDPTKDEVKKIIEERYTGQQKTNLLGVLDDLMYIQEQYKVNAIFAIAVTQLESSCGTAWGLIDSSTYNWCSIQGSHNGNSYTDTNGTAWRKYSSFNEAIRDFGDLIANSGPYFKDGKYSINEIGAIYCDDEWSNIVSDLVSEMYQIIGQSVGSGNNDSDADANNNKIVIKPNEHKTGYEMVYNNDPENIKNIKKKLEAETPKSASQFSEFELAVLGALMDNGSDLDYYTKEQLKCFPAFIKAEACTQYLDLRPNSQKMKNGKYEPRNIKDLKEEEVPGVILVQRTNTKDNSSTILEYKQKADFDKMVKENNKDAIKYFTISDEGNLVIAKWEHIKITVNGSYPDHLDDSEKDTPKDENIIRTEEIPYSEYIKKYTMPFEFLVQLLVVTEEPDFCMELVDHVLESKIVINIEEQETFSETTEEKNYKVHSKDEKRLDYNIKVGDNSVESGEEFLKKKKDDENKDCTNYATKDMTVIVNTQRTTHSYVFEILEADTWIAHYTKEYQKQNAKDDVSGPNSTDVKGEYKELGTKDIVDQSAISGDGDVQDFIGENKANYDQQIIDPIDVTITSGTHDNGDKFKQIHYIHNGSVERVDGLVNGGTIYNEIKDYQGRGSGIYDLPSSLSVVMEEVPATEKTAKIPSIRYDYVLNEAQTKYELQNIVNAEVIVTKLNIKEFEKIDLKVTTTTTTTDYPADPAPKTEIHIYATKDGEPGKGHGDKNTEYEKFLVAYDNNKNARDQINSIDSWLYEMMERESTVEFIDIVKYLLYMYDGKNRGVTELEGFEDVFAPSSFTGVTGIYGGTIEEKVWFTLIGEGYSEIAVAGVMGNIYGESGFRADAVEGGSGEGHGLCQWSFGRKTSLINYARSKGKDWTDEDTQIEFLIGEITKGGGANGYASFQMSGTCYGYTYSSWKDAKDIAEATKAFMAVFERPDMSVAHTDTRIAAAEGYYNEFHGKERSGGDFNAGSGKEVGRFTSGITGKTFTIFNQTSLTQSDYWWHDGCNNCVAACLASAYYKGNNDNILSEVKKYSYILSDQAGTTEFFAKYGLKAQVSGGGSYSIENMRSNLLKGNYIAIWFNSQTYGKSGSLYTNYMHWIGIIGYKKENGKEMIFISDSAWGASGWKDIDEFEGCKGNIGWFTVVSEK